MVKGISVPLVMGWGAMLASGILGLLLAVLVLFNKALNDMVHVSRAFNGLPRLDERDDVSAPRQGVLRRLRAAAQTRYQLTRTLAPYVELGWEKDVGRTGALARARDERGENTYAVAGVRLLY